MARPKKKQESEVNTATEVVESDSILMQPPAWAHPPKTKESKVTEIQKDVKVTGDISPEEQELLSMYREGKVIKPSNIIEKEDLSNMAMLEGRMDNASQVILKLSIDIVNAEKQRDGLVEQLNELRTTHQNFMTKFEAKYGLMGRKWEIEPSTGKIKLKEVK